MTTPLGGKVHDTVEDASRVGYFEAEDPDLIKGKDAQANGRKKKRMVTVDAITMRASLPEQGSWHYDRKKEVIAKHPEILKLYGQNPWSFLIMLCVNSIHIFIALHLEGTSWPFFLFVSYTIGVYLNWVAMVMGHEGSHGLVFKNRALNKLHTIITFIPLFIGPFGAFWSIEHMYHHQVVVDKMERYGPQNNKLPKKILLSLFYISAVGLMFFIASVIALARDLLYLGLYSIGQVKTPFPEKFTMRPYRNFPQVAGSGWFVLNMFLIFAFNSYIYTHYGLTPLLYFFFSNAFCNGLHPLGMRQVQEHYIQRRGQPTNSVYSPLDPFLFNIGYHNEHHDFPTIPWSRLPQVRKIAPEFYENLFYYDSYTQVMWEFFTKEGIPFTSLMDDLYEEPGVAPNSNGKKSD